MPRLRKVPRTIITVLTAMAATHASGASLERPDETLRQLLANAVTAARSFGDRFDAEVWLLDMSTRLSGVLADPETRFTILRAVHREAARVDLEPELVLSVITVESLFDRYALSEAGARGLMQVEMDPGNWTVR